MKPIETIVEDLFKTFGALAISYDSTTGKAVLSASELRDFRLALLELEQHVKPAALDGAR